MTRRHREKKEKYPVKGLLKNVLEEIIFKSQEFLPEELAQKYDRLYQITHVNRLSKRLLAFYREEDSLLQPKPYFNSECTPELVEVFEPFKPFMKRWLSNVNLAEIDKQAKKFAQLIEEQGIGSVLILLGQRLTPGSLKDERAIPPLRTPLLQSAVAPYNEELTEAARALSKHAERSDIRFWGDVTGDPERKNKKGRQLIDKILKDYSWWNVFVHSSLGEVYEARVPSGHGARWTLDGSKFIGFLEPFLDE